MCALACMHACASAYMYVSLYVSSSKFKLI